MNSTQYRFLQTREKKKRKGLQLNLFSEPSEQNVFSLSTDLDPETYANTFNAHVHHLKNSESQSNPPQLFTWDQKQQYPSKLNPAPQLVQSYVLPSTTSRFTADVVKEEVKTSDEPLPQKVIRHLNRSVTKQAHRRDGIMGGLNNNLRSLTPLVKSHKAPGLDLEKVETPGQTSSFHVKTSYSISRLQTNLLKSPNETLGHNIPNYNHMLNHFNKKNFTINKVISQVNPDPEMLDKEELLEETKAKISYVSKEYPLKQFLRFIINSAPLEGKRTKGPSPSKRYYAREQTVVKENVRNDTLEMSPFKKQIALDKGSPGALEISPSPMLGNEGEKITQDEKSPRFDLRKRKDISELNLNIKKKENDSRLMKWEGKGLVEGLAHNLQKIEERSYMGLTRDEWSSADFHKKSRTNTLKSKKYMKSESVLYKNSNSNNSEQLESLTNSMAKVDTENIFYYKTYFKKKYLESGLTMDVSPSLKAKIHSIEKDIKGAMKRINFVELRKKDVQKLDRGNTVVPGASIELKAH